MLHGLLRPGGELHVADFGAPRSAYARLVSHVFRHFDGEQRTADNLGGRLDSVVAAAGFRAVALVGHRSTPFGTIEYLSAQA